MSRTSSPTELLYGPTIFASFMVWLGLTQFMTMEGAIIMGAVGMGDGLAPLMGKYFGRTKYRVPFGNEKSLEGSILGVFLGTISGSYLYAFLLGLEDIPEIKLILACAFLATVVEGTSPGDFDNITVPLVLHFSLKHVPSLL